MAGGESILVLEDNQSIRSFVRMVLAERGYQVIEARAGWQALKLAEASPPDVMLLDWQLPDITGLDVLRALRAGKVEAPAILMTAFGSEELAMVALRLGVCDYLQKPFESDDLMRAIEGALAQIRIRRDHAELVEQLRRLEHMAQSAAKAKSSLLKLARWMDELERGLPPEVRPRVRDAHHYLREIAEVFEGQPRPSG